MTRPRRHAGPPPTPSLRSWAEAFPRLERLVEIHRQGGGWRAEALASLEVLGEEVVGRPDNVDGIERLVPAWSAVTVELGLYVNACRLEAELERDERADLAAYSWRYSQIDASLSGRPDLKLVFADEQLILYRDEAGKQYAWERHPTVLDAWRWADHDVSAGVPLAPQANLNRGIDQIGPRDVVGLQVAVDNPPDPPTAPEVVELFDQLGEVGAQLRGFAEEVPDVASELERLGAAIAHAGEDPDALRAVLKDARRVLTTQRVRETEEERKGREQLAEEPAQDEQAAGEGGDRLSPVPQPSSPAAPHEEAAAGAVPEATAAEATPVPETAISSAAGLHLQDAPLAQERERAVRAGEFDGDDGEGGAGPIVGAFEEARGELLDFAAQIASEGARKVALDTIGRAQTYAELQNLRNRVNATFKEETDLHRRAAEIKAMREAKAAPAESALTRKRKEVRGTATMEAAKVDPGVKELRKRVLALLQEAHGKGTPPRALTDAIKEADYQGLKLHEERLLVQVAARPDRGEPEPDLGDEELPWELSGEGS